MSQPSVLAASTDDAFVGGVSTLVGGPTGRHARPVRRAWVLVIALIAATLTCGLGYLQKAPCLTHPWSNSYQYSRLCYSDIFALYGPSSSGGEGLNSGEIPYRNHPVEYPVLIGGAMEVASLVAHHFTGSRLIQGTEIDNGHPERVFFVVTALLLSLAALVTVASVWALAGRRRPWDALLVAVAPVLLLHAFTNWDLIAVAFATAGMWAWARRRPVLAGVLLGLGVATKLYPVFILVALGMLCLRERRRDVWRAWAIASASAVGAFAVVTAPVYLFVARSFPYPANAAGCPTHPVNAVEWFWRLNSARGADWDSLWYAFGFFHHRQLDSNVTCNASPTALNVWVAVAFIAVLVVIGLAVRAAPRRPRVASVAFLVVAAFLLTNKVDSPQYVLWLLPLAVLARPRWGAFLVWQATEVAVLITRFYMFIGQDTGQSAGLPPLVFEIAVFARDAALIALMLLVVREMLAPRRDVIRRESVDDPAGGVLVGSAGSSWALA